jgi:hypothetical protein
MCAATQNWKIKRRQHYGSKQFMLWKRHCVEAKDRSHRAPSVLDTEDSDRGPETSTVHEILRDGLRKLYPLPGGR